jgi:competence protein ComEC
MTRAGLVALLAVAAALGGCPAAVPPRPVSVPPPVAVEPRPPVEPTVTWQRVASLDEVPGAPPAGSWRIHMIDVGTGLAILVQGADFTLLYDAGTNDAKEKPARVLGYLAAALGGESGPIDHMVLSHPHLDHASALDTILFQYDVAHVWDSGRVNQAVFYREFLEGIGREAGATYHTAGEVPPDRTVHVKGFDVTIPEAVAWQTFSEGDVVELGADARFTLLHAEAKEHRDPNENSVVLLVELGATRLLLTGDAESGPRADPGAALGDIEQHLVDHFAAEIDVDILQVGHHGSKTSSRRAFLEAVSPSLALISAGPKAYSGTTLPDPEVIAALAAVGATVLRTDEHDADCASGPGGCDSWVVTIEGGGASTSSAPPRSSGTSRGASSTPR